MEVYFKQHKGIENRILLFGLSPRDARFGKSKTEGLNLNLLVVKANRNFSIFY